MATGIDPAEGLRVASEGFDLLFSNDLVGAVNLFSADGYQNSPFHLMGLGVCAFLKAALGMEVRGVSLPCVARSRQLSAVSPSSWTTLHNASSHHRRGQRSS